MKIAVVPELFRAPVILRRAWLIRRACRPTWLSALQPSVAPPLPALDLGARHEGGHRVDDDDVERAGADEHVGDLERLLTGVGLADQEGIGVDADGPGVLGVERVLGVDERRDTAT